MNGRKALGKGLSALLPDDGPIAARSAGDRALEVPVASLEPNPFQPRSVFAPGPLAELVASLRETGMVQPILVRRRGDRYQIIAGERRHRAAQALGLATVPVVVREVPDDRLLELALVENIQRAELTPSRRPTPMSACSASSASPRRRSPSAWARNGQRSQTSCACFG
jgi:ParB family transcriptional regulator, chromosome partitioning protein